MNAYNVHITIVRYTTAQYVHTQITEANKTAKHVFAGRLYNNSSTKTIHQTIFN